MCCNFGCSGGAADDNQTNFEPSKGANTTEEKLWIRMLLADGHVQVYFF